MARILVVDDEKHITDAWKHYLETNQHTVVVANSGREAIEKIVDEDFDLLVLDIYMPDGDGLEVLTWLRGVEKSLKIIVISGCGNCGISYLEAARYLGAHKTILKPVKLSKLHETIIELLA